MFQYHTFSHHSQTCRNVLYRLKNFSTIRFYIILKLRLTFSMKSVVSVPYVFTSFSNTHPACFIAPCVSVPYIFTSFSNLRTIYKRQHKFQYHTFLHHSQTTKRIRNMVSLFQYHTFLHHSQTYSNSSRNI